MFKKTKLIETSRLSTGDILLFNDK